MRPLALPEPGFQAVTYARHPITGDCWRGVMPEGLTLAEMAAQVPGLPASFHLYGTICIDGAEVKRYLVRKGHVIDRWQRIRPKCRADGTARVTFHLSLHGKGIRNVLSIVAAVALVAVSAWISGGGLAAAFPGLFGGLFGAGSTSALLLASAVGILGRFALTALAPPAARGKDDGRAAALGNAGADGNSLQPGGPIPRVAGRIKVFPPLAAQPLIDLSGDDEYVEAAYLLAGPHELSDLRAEGASFGDIEGLQHVTDDGTAGTPARLLSRFGKQRMVQFEMKAHQRDHTNTDELRPQDNVESALPTWRTEISSLDPDEIWLHLVWPSGMGKQNGTTDAAMPLRLRMRELGTDAWINLPELMFRHRKTGAIRKQVKLIWGDAGIAGSSYIYGAWQAFHTVPADNFGNGGWAAHSSFIGTAGIANATARVSPAYDGFTIWLDPAVFPRGKVWEVQAMRGCLLSPSLLTPSTYIYAFPVPQPVNFFGWSGSTANYLVPAHPFYDATIIETCTLTRFASVWNRPPLPLGGHAKIELRAKNIQAQRVSCMAAGLIPLWDGTAWDGFGTSDNPADHYRHVLTGSLTRDPVTPEEEDVEGLLAWRAHCTAKGYTIAAAFDGRSWQETLAAIAACGKARRKEGQRFGVVYERDRAAEAPTQVVNARNAANVTLIKSFEPVSEAFRVTFRNSLKDYEPDERLVVRPGLAAAAVTDIVPVDAVGVTDPALIDALFGLDLKLGDARDHLLECDVHVDHLVSEPGDMVQVNHIILSRHHRSVRIRDIETDGSGNALAVGIDALKPLTGAAGQIEAIPAIETVAEMADAGIAMGCMIRTAANTVVEAELANAAGRSGRLVFAAPIPAAAGIAAGNIVHIGPAEQVSERYLIQDIQPGRGFNLRLSLIPEAPEAFL